MPRIPISLKREDRDAVIDLQKLLHELYDAAGYADYIYSGSPRPAISDNDQTWVADIVATNKGVRSL